jgi:hypothetical protein
MKVKGKNRKNTSRVDFSVETTEVDVFAFLSIGEVEKVMDFILPTFSDLPGIEIRIPPD